MSSRISVTSSRLKLSGIGRSRKLGCERNLASMLLQQRQGLRIIKDDTDVTPKPLIHPAFSVIEENQATALETLGIFQTGSSAQLMSLSDLSGLKASSSILLKSSMPSDDMQLESLLTTQVCDYLQEEEDAAPAPFFLPTDDPAILFERPETVTITLKETKTFFIFEMPQLTGDLSTPEGQAIKQENDYYEYVTVGPGSNRKLVDAETQTICVLTKSRGTYLAAKPRKNQGMFVNNWVIHDTYAAPELMTEKDGRLTVHSRESMRRLREAQELRYKLPEPEVSPDPSVEEQLSHICQNTRFRDAARVMERLIANNVYLAVQKRFTSVTVRDPCALDLCFDYRLDLLWTHVCDEARGCPVASFRWSPANASVLAVGYGARNASEDKRNGLVLIWSVKNPSHPARQYTFKSPVSDINWSTSKPNLLAIGFHDGNVKVIDVSAKDLNVIRKSRRETSSACSPHWQVQWWTGDEQFDYQEQIYTSDQDGRVYCYRSGEDFLATEIMRLYRIEGKLMGVARNHYCVAQDVPISRQPGALVLRRHPSISNIYLVGSDEGCIYRCSTTYLRQHMDSFSAHDGPVYSLEFSPFCQKLFLTCGADWCTRIWAEGLTEPLITLSTTMACVRSAQWSPTCSTVVANVINDRICIWDIRRKTYSPVSVTISSNGARLVAVDFTSNGNQLVAADIEGAIYVYNLEGMPFPPYDQNKVLIESIHKALMTKPELLRKLKKLGPPF